FISEIVHTEDSFLLKLYYKFNFATEPQIFYVWNQKEYLASEIYDLTEEEKREVNNQMINEIEEE
ncbi:hypothetical protein Q1L79_11845, partial [Staphylococcus haemolyticus]|uniref:hypothetical protein n=1 Tax=Staphylococcus haemolyticus TaxID=1283 RepID=UPI00265C8187